MAAVAPRLCPSRTPDAHWRGSPAWVAALLGLLVAGAALPGVGPEDRRIPMDQSSMPWAALARVQVPGTSRCTAFLIDPHTAVTAAHCLYSRPLGRMVPATAVHVLVGYARGGFAAHRIAASLTTFPGFRPGGTAPDVAVIHFDDAPIGLQQALALLDTPLPAGTPLMLGGYGQDRNEVMTADTRCSAQGYASTSQGAALVHDCAGTHGTSGAPLLARAPSGQWAVAGMQVAARADGSGGTALPAAAIRSLISR